MIRPATQERLYHDPAAIASFEDHLGYLQRWEADAWGDHGGGGGGGGGTSHSRGKPDHGLFWLDGVAVGPTPPQPNHRERLQGLAQHKGEAQRRQDAQIAASSLIAVEIDLKLPPEGAPIALKAPSMRCRVSLSPVEILIHLPFVP